MKSIIFVTGNKEKLIDARGVCDNYDISIEQQPVHVDEIQHHDPCKITEHKAKSAYEIIKKPLVVNDSAWEIPALNGFPGGYMKDVAGWLSEAAF